MWDPPHGGSLDSKYGGHSSPVTGAQVLWGSSPGSAQGHLQPAPSRRDCGQRDGPDQGEGGGHGCQDLSTRCKGLSYERAPLIKP